MYIEKENIKNKEDIKVDNKKTFWGKLGQANPWNIFWIMYFSCCIIEAICTMIVALAR